MTRHVDLVNKSTTETPLIIELSFYFDCTKEIVSYAVKKPIRWFVTDDNQSLLLKQMHADKLRITERKIANIYQDLDGYLRIMLDFELSRCDEMIVTGRSTSTFCNRKD